MKVKSVTMNKAETVYDIETPCHDYILSTGLISHNTMDQYNPMAMGGDGARYNASVVLFLTKRKERDGDRNVIGNVIHSHADKSRLTREQSKVDTRLFFDTGLDKHYGLVELAVESGVWKKVSTRIETHDGGKFFQSVIERDPEKFFTKDVLDKIDEYCKTKFCYGSHEQHDEIEEELEDILDV